MNRLHPGMSSWGASRRLGRLVAQAAQLTVVYLGIAVLVAGVLAASVPFVREQISSAHRVWLDAFRPAGGLLVAGNRGSADNHQETPDSLSAIAPVMASDELTLLDEEKQLAKEQPAEGVAGAEETVQSDLNFTRALVDAEERVVIPGVTASQVQALRRYISRKYRIAGNVTGALIKTVFAVGREFDLEPQLLLAVIAIESRYNPYAESHMGAQGLMQVMTKVHKEKFAAFGEGEMAAVHPLANIRVGAQILADCIRRRGSLDGGLACYVGATGPGDGGYGAKVKAERSRLALASGIPVWRDQAQLQARN